MIWKIAKKEFLLNVMTFKFVVGTILSVVVISVFMPVLAKDYQQRLKAYNANVTDNEAELRKVMVYRNIIPTIYRPPNILSVFSEGVEKRLGTSAKIEHSSVPEISATSDEVNPYMSMFPALDISLVLWIVFSALALLVAYNVISGEREQGTLKLTLSNTIGRYQVLLGKLLAGLMILLVPVTFVFILALLLLLSFPMIELAVSDWVGIGLMYVASLVFISVMYNLGLLFSALMRRSTISLVLGLFAWVVFVVVVPNGSIYLAAQISPLESEEKLEGQRTLAKEEYSVKSMEVIGKFPGRWGPKSDAAEAFGQSYIVVCATSCLQDSSRYYPLEEQLRNNYSDSIWKIELSYLTSLLEQKHLARNIARISPVSVYENVMSALAGSDLAGFQSFMDNARAYRNIVFEYIRSKTGNFSSSSYFTICNKEDGLIYGKIWKQRKEAQNDTEKQRARDALKELYDKKKAVASSLDLQDFPRFTYHPSVAKSLKGAIPDLMLLVFVNVLLFTLSFVAFIRYDVRSD